MSPVWFRRPLPLPAALWRRVAHTMPLVLGLMLAGAAAAPARAQLGTDAATTLLRQLNTLEKEVQRLTAQVEQQSADLRRLRTELEDVNVRLDDLEGAGTTPPAVATPGFGASPDSGLNAGRLATSDPVITRPSDTPAAFAEPTPGALTSRDLATAAPPAGPELPATPAELYNYAFRRIQARDFSGAEYALQTFIDRYPDHELSSRVHHWLGETYYVQNDFASAQQQYATGVKLYPQGEMAADSLFKLADTFRRRGQQAEACTVYNSLVRSYPDANRSLLDQANQQIVSLGC